MSFLGLAREQVEPVVQQARRLVEAYERRSESSEFTTLGEEDALMDLWLALESARKHRPYMKGS